MQYVSPITFLPPGLDGEITPKDLKLAKQKLLAEFELSGTTTVPVGGREMSRNDVLKLFDQLGQANDLAYHGLIASDPVLLHFLETHEIAKGQTFSLPEEKVTPEFVEWISPSFSWAFGKATVRMFRTVKPEEFETLAVAPWYMTPADEWNAWSGVEQYMQLMLQQLQEITGAKYQSQDQVIKYGGYNFIWLLCNLPRQRFDYLLDHYAFEVMQMAIKQFNTLKRDSAFELMGYAKSLKVSDHVMEGLEAKEKEMQGILKNRKKAENKDSTMLYIRVIIFAAYIIFRLATCN